MATFSYMSSIDYGQSGNSDNYKDDTSAANVTGSLTDADGGATFDVGDTFNEIAGTFFGSYTDGGGNVYMIVQTSPEPGGEWTIYSPVDAATTTSNLPNTINSVNDVNTAGLACFLTGVMIATPVGEVAVEDLKIGDALLTASGDVSKVLWIGRNTVATRFGPAERLMPVRFAAGSLGDSLPHTDLTVTADHAMLIDGVLCNAGALVNDVTITRVPPSDMGETFTVYHVETEAHEIILANGAPAETFIDNVSRRVFDNYAEYDALYGDTPEMAELPYPRAMSARQVPARLRAKLAAQKAA
ncbi:Hint domain-containing protein [Falsiphaeobacter marinintestinus]|uniref:Hint domain-containing protein n=1 Tax=Falsiphaeobacter marinintestinus TaxID=1492905 RepID=UPI0011B3E930|nr:Hint domain-containing protein [Phaeobacter marinintestinus]